MANYWTAFEWSRYEKNTDDLSVTEHGAYFLLLKHYYKTRKPLVANASRLLAVCRAVASHEQEAVLMVLDRYFTLESDGYHNQTADEEIEKSSQLAEKRRVAGKKGGDNKASQGKQMPSNCQSFAIANGKQLPPQSQSQLQLHNKTLKPAAEPPQRDERFQQFMAELSEYWTLNNPDLPFEPGARGGKALKEFLKSHPKLTVTSFHRLLVNRANSEGVSLSEEIWAWLPHLLKYGSGPLNQFKNVAADCVSSGGPNDSWMMGGRGT